MVEAGRNAIVVSGQAVPFVVGERTVPAVYRLSVRTDWLEGKQAELERAQTALRELRLLKPDSAKTRRVAERVGMLRKCVEALHAGYIPVPRFSSHTLDLDMEELPSAALQALSDADERTLFSEYRLVSGDVGDSRRGWARRVARDPLLVGVIRTVGYVLNPNDPIYMQQRVPPREEHFLIAWWRVEDERDDDLF